MTTNRPVPGEDLCCFVRIYPDPTDVVQRAIAITIGAAIDIVGERLGEAVVPLDVRTSGSDIAAGFLVTEGAGVRLARCMNRWQLTATDNGLRFDGFFDEWPTSACSPARRMAVLELTADVDRNADPDFVRLVAHLAESQRCPTGTVQPQIYAGGANATIVATVDDSPTAPLELEAWYGAVTTELDRARDRFVLHDMWTFGGGSAMVQRKVG